MRGGRALGCAGFIGVVNRSQKNIEERLEIKEAQKAEQEFFDGHPSYANMSNRLGIPYLSKTLSVTLMRHVRSCQRCSPYELRGSGSGGAVMPL